MALSTSRKRKASESFDDEWNGEWGRPRQQLPPTPSYIRDNYEKFFCAERRCKVIRAVAGVEEYLDRDFGICHFHVLPTGAGASLLAGKKCEFMIWQAIIQSDWFIGNLITWREYDSPIPHPKRSKVDQDLMLELGCVETDTCGLSHPQPEEQDHEDTESELEHPEWEENDWDAGEKMNTPKEINDLNDVLEQILKGDDCELLHMLGSIFAEDHVKPEYGFNNMVMLPYFLGEVDQKQEVQSASTESETDSTHDSLSTHTDDDDSFTSVESCGSEAGDSLTT